MILRNIKTIPHQEVQLTLFNPSTLSFLVIEMFKNISDDYGDVSFIHSSSSPKFGIIIYIKQDGVKLISKKYEEVYTAGDVINLRIAPKWFDFIETPSNNITLSNETNSSDILVNESSNVISNDTLNDTLNEINNVSEENSKITGNFISENFLNSKFLLKNLPYFAIVVFVFILVFLVSLKLRHKQILKYKYGPEQKQDNIKVKKLSEFKAEKEKEKNDKKDLIKENVSSKISSELSEAEKKLKDAQKEVEKLKSEERIKEIKSKMVDYENELMKLRKKEERNSEDKSDKVE